MKISSCSLATLAIAFVLLAAITITGCVTNEYSSAHATNEARSYLSQLYPDCTILSIVPAGQDSDGDGYVSVTARIQDKAGKTSVVSLNCAGNPGFSGCKLAQGQLINQ